MAETKSAAGSGSAARTDPPETPDEPVRLLDFGPEVGLDEAIDRCRDLVEDTEFPTVRRWREAGGKVVGHFQVYFPEELAHAAGVLPVKVRGEDGDRSVIVAAP